MTGSGVPVLSLKDVTAIFLKRIHYHPDVVAQAMKVLGIAGERGVGMLH